MKKINFKKAMAAVAAMSLVACAASVSASAAEGGVTIEIDQYTVTLEELAAMDADTATDGYQVPIYVTLVENAGVAAAEFGVVVDDRCTFEIFSVSKKAEAYGEALDWKMTTSTNGQLTWCTWASSEVDDYSENILMVLVTVPATAAEGEVYTINYVEENTKLHIWNNTVDGVNHVEAGTVSWTDGFVEIKAAETTEETTEEVTTEEVTTEEVTDAPTTEAPTEEATKAPESSTASPATGSADVLPIVGAAAAIAVLGGVAMVSKKKD